jgi:peptidoglycan/LPS O-acetylase OafA/YrhL
MSLLSQVSSDASPYNMLFQRNQKYELLSEASGLTSFQAIPGRTWQFFRHGARNALLFCIPSFLSNQKPTSLHAVASLDGLRGYASFGVFTIHFTDTFCQMHNKGFGVTDDDHYLIQLPFIHFFWTAPSLVACFFVISGYVLSYKPIKLIRAQSHDQFLRAMTSAIFRRGIRLYLPITLATFICFLFVCIGAFDYPHQVFAKGGYLAAGEDTPPILPTINEQFWHWWQTTKDMLYPFRWGGGGTPYDPHLWTIPTEFQGSMLLFMTLIGLSGSRAWIRLAIAALFIVYCTMVEQNEILLFFCGMFLAELDMILREDAKHRVKSLRWLWLSLFMVGAYLVGMPSWSPEITPGYKTIMWLHSNWFRWHSLGCVLLVWGVRNSDDIQFLFTNRVAQYLGNISFSLYIVHGNVRRSVSYALMPSLLEMINGNDSKFRYGIVVFLNFLVTYPLTFFLADIWWRAVDTPSMRFARWLEEKTWG